MKIGFIYDAAHPWSIGGGEKHLYELARQLVARGHEVHIFCMQYWEGPADLVHDGLHYHAVCPNLPLYGASGKRAIWPAVRFAWGLLLRLPRRGLDELDVVDVLAFPFISVVAFCVVRLLFFRKVPWLLSWLEVWGLRYWRRYLGCRGWVGATIEWLAARLAPVHLCISRLTAGRLHTLLRIPSRKIVVIPRGIELPAGLPHGVAKQQRRVVVVGRLVAYKRVDLVIRAWPTVVQRFPDAELCIIGDGPARPALEKQVQAVGMQESICFRGQLPAREAVLAEIEEASLLALPSEREGQGVVVLEAMALGTAVLVADGCETAAPELLTTEEQRKWCALPHTAGADAWAERIIQLLDDRERLERLALAGKRQSAEYALADHIVPRVERVYQLRTCKRSRLDNENQS